MKPRCPRWGAWICAAIVFAASLLLAGGHLYSPDEEILFRLTQNLAEHGRWDIEPIAGFATRPGRGGLEYPQYPPLQSILAIPLYELGKLTKSLVADSTISRIVWETTQYHDGSAESYWKRFVVVLLFVPLVTALTTALVFRMAWRLSGGDRFATWGTALGYGLGSYALAHSRTFFTEPLSTLWWMLALWALLEWSEELAARDAWRAEEVAAATGEPTDAPRVGGARWAAIASLACAAGIWTRVDFPLYLPGIAIGVLALGVRQVRGTANGTRELLRGACAFIVPLAIAGGMYLFFNWWRFGGVAETGYKDQEEGVKFATPLLVGFTGFLGSPGKGIFYFTPLLALALFGLRNAFAGRREWTIAWAVSLVVFLVAMCKWQNWAGGWCWGPRHIYQIHAPLMLGLATLLRAPRAALARIAYPVLLIVGFSIQVFGASQSFIDYYLVWFRTPQDQPSYHSLYYPDENALFARSYRADALTANGPVPVPMSMLPAPLINSIYLPQHSQWAAYPEMWKLGYTDLLWIRLWQAARLAPEIETKPPAAKQ